jgi:hypothetical protein
MFVWRISKMRGSEIAVEMFWQRKRKKLPNERAIVRTSAMFSCCCRVRKKFWASSANQR